MSSSHWLLRSSFMGAWWSEYWLSLFAVRDSIERPLPSSGCGGCGSGEKRLTAGLASLRRLGGRSGVCSWERLVTGRSRQRKSGVRGVRVKAPARLAPSASPTFGFKLVWLYAQQRWIIVLATLCDRCRSAHAWAARHNVVILSRRAVLHFPNRINRITLRCRLRWSPYPTLRRWWGL